MWTDQLQNSLKSALTSPPNTGEFQLQISSDIPLFEGHFENAPVLPAIAVLEISSWLINNYLSEKKQVITGIEKTKFLSILQPGEEVLISIVKTSLSAYDVSWVRGDKCVSSLKLKMETFEEVLIPEANL